MTAVVPAGSFPPVQSSLSQPLPVVQELPVQTPSGQVIHVLGTGEQDFYNLLSQRYQREFGFTNVSDLLDLDQLLFLELQIHRMTVWLGRGRDYDGALVDIVASRRALKETSILVSSVKQGLGMTKAQRDKEKDQGTGHYLQELKRRAKEFGVHREKQLTRTLALQQQLFSIVGSFDRADAIEREKLGFPDEASILAWIRDTMRPQYDELDAHFRMNQQRYWLKEI